jgi:hypothetical protein
MSMISMTCHAEDLILCLHPVVGKTNLRLQFNGDEWLTGTSIYCNQRTSMTLKQIKYKSVKDYPDRPSEFNIRWNEYLNGKVTGYYSVNLQGVNFYKAYYYNYKNKRKTYFESSVVNEIKDCDCN